MVWLVTHIWIGLALAALFGLIFGWAFRGLKLKARARDAMVARDIALTELEQSRLEIDQLYAAQSKGVEAAAQAGDEALRLELEAREEKLQTLSRELAASQDALEDLKSKAVAGAVAAGAIGVAGAALTGAETQKNDTPPERLDADLNLNDASLEWRNRYLASRVRALETAPKEDAAPDRALLAELEAAKLQASEAASALETFKAEAEDEKQSAIAAALGASVASAGLGVGATLLANGDETEREDDAALSGLGAQKQAWQNDYLRQRLDFAQEGLLAAEEAVVEEVPRVEAPSETPAETIVVPNLPDAQDTVAAEKLAWQNKYLRQRAAYLETHAPKDRVAPNLVPDLVNDDEAPEPQVTDEGAGAFEPAPEALDAADGDAELGGDSETDTARESGLGGAAAGLSAGLGGAGIGAAASAVDPGELEQELARLRWRNRYLEGRLAYIDGDAEVKTEEANDTEETEETKIEEPMPEYPRADTGLSAFEPVTGPRFAASDEEPIIEVVQTGPDVFSGGTFIDDEDVAEPTAADAVLAAINGEVLSNDLEAPDKMAEPENGGDDLTRINGVGKSTANALNEIGIWHYHQIAGWTPENVNWVNKYFEENRRIEQQEWVTQAGALSLGADFH